MGASLDLRKAHAHHNFGEIVQILTWVNDERAMVLVPALRKGAPWFIVCDSASWKWDSTKPTEYPATLDVHGRPLRGPTGQPIPDLGKPPIAGEGYVVMMAKKAAQILGMDGNYTWLKIAAIIEEGIPDLIRMPSAPMPSYLKAAFGSMELRENGKTIAQEDIKLETEGAEYAPATVH